jgi:uncharacterized membrane protein YphA (DoxX/SURF4 family)
MKNYLTLKNLGWFITIIVSLMLCMSGCSKVMATEEMVKNFTYTNLLPQLSLVGFMEIVGVLLLVYPRTSIYGAVVLSSIMSGAVAIHMSYMGGAGILLPILLGLGAWAGHCLRTYTIKTV